VLLPSHPSPGRTAGEKAGQALAQRGSESEGGESRGSDAKKRRIVDGASSSLCARYAQRGRGEWPGGGDNVPKGGRKRNLQQVTKMPSNMDEGKRMETYRAGVEYDMRARL